MTTEPKWTSEAPVRWGRYYEAWYQISHALPVLVDGFCRTEEAARTRLDNEVPKVIKQLKDLGLKNQITTWTVHKQSRQQSRVFPREPHKIFEVTE